MRAAQAARRRPRLPQLRAAPPGPRPRYPHPLPLLPGCHLMQRPPPATRGRGRPEREPDGAGPGCGAGPERGGHGAGAGPAGPPGTSVSSLFRATLTRFSQPFALSFSSLKSPPLQSTFFSFPPFFNVFSSRSLSYPISSFISFASPASVTGSHIDGAL